MKKTLTVNLGGTVFHIDEDAYQLLDNYLSNLRAHFSKDEDAEEIMNDFEARISELFSERVRLGHEVITITEVEEVIKRMGRPEEIFEGESKHSDNNNDTNDTNDTDSNQEQAGKKKLMRDPDNKIIGGVCSGLATYFGWDITAVRIIFIALIFFPYCPIILIYLIMWLITPIALTASDRLQMRGESITVENIGKTVTNSFEQSNNKANDTTDKKDKNPIHNIGDNIVSIVGFILKVLAIIIGVIALPILAIILFLLIMIAIGMIGLITGVGNIVFGLCPFDCSLLSMLPTWLSVMACLGVILTVGIPVFSLIYAICASIFKLKPISNPIKWTLLVLWIIGVAISVISALNILNVYSYLPITTIHKVYFS